jgi:hypothetical protein
VGQVLDTIQFAMLATATWATLATPVFSIAFLLGWIFKKLKRLGGF